MKIFHWSGGLAAVVATAVLLTASTGASAASNEYTIGFINSLTGPAAGLGIPYSRGIKLAHLYKSKVDGRNIKIIKMSDGSNPTVAAREAKKLIDVDHVDLLLGTAPTPSGLAVSAVASANKTPFITGAQVTPYNKTNSWTVNSPQPISVVMLKIAARMKHNGVKTVGYIGFADAWGDEVYNSLQHFAKIDGYKVVADQRYARSDASVTGQVLKIISKHPDAVINGGSGVPGALPYVEFAKYGYKGQIYGTHAYMDEHFVKACGSACEGMIAASGPLEIAEDLPDSNPSKAISMKYRKMYKETFHEPLPAAFSSYPFDGYLIFLNAAKRVPKSIQPGTQKFRTALKDAIQTTTDLAGTQAVYTFTPGHVYGVTPASIFIVKLENGVWHWDPLKKK